MDPEKAKHYIPKPLIFKYTARDTIIYALGIGATPDNGLQFLYENHDNFQVFPTYVVAAALQASSLSDWPGIDFNLQKILHGEQYVELFEPLPAGDGELRAETRVVDLLDKGSGALILVEVTLYDNNTDKKLCLQQLSIFQVGSGKFGGSKSSPFERKCINVPDEPPHKIFVEQVQNNQAALYRYGGNDPNPLHIDPQFAKMSGFERPILHGLCTYGIAARQILAEYGDNDAVNFKAMKARFSAPVLPGQTLITETWKVGNCVHFQCKTKESVKIVLASAYVDLHKSQQPSPPAVSSASSVQSAVIFQTINEELPASRDAIAKVNSLIVYNITQKGKSAATFTLNLKNEPFGVYEGLPNGGEKAAVTVTVDDDDFIQLAAGKLDGIKATTPESVITVSAWSFLIPSFLLDHHHHLPSQSPESQETNYCSII